MLDDDLTTRCRYATSVFGCSGTQAPGQRQWRAGAPADPLHIFPLTPHWRDSLITDRAAARSRSFLRIQRSVHPWCARICGREGQPHHFWSTPLTWSALHHRGIVAAFSWWVFLFSSERCVLSPMCTGDIWRVVSWPSCGWTRCLF